MYRDPKDVRSILLIQVEIRFYYEPRTYIELLR